MTDDGNLSRHGAPTPMLPSPEASEPDARTSSGDYNSEPPTRKTTFSDLPQEIRDMIWKEVLLDEDDLNIPLHSRVHNGRAVLDPTSDILKKMYPPRERRRLIGFERSCPPSIPITLLLSARAPTLAHTSHDARKAALEHYARKLVGKGSDTFLRELDIPPWLSRSRIPIAPEDYLSSAKKFPHDRRYDIFESPSVLLHIASRWWDHKQNVEGSSHASDAWIYQFLRNARDNQVMVVIPWILVYPLLKCSQRGPCPCAFLSPGTPPHLWDEALDTTVFQDVYVEAQDPDMLRCIIQAADKCFHVVEKKNPMRLGPPKSLPDKDFIAGLTKKASAFLHALWVEESRKALREGDDMPKVRFVIEITFLLYGRDVDLPGP